MLKGIRVCICLEGQLEEDRESCRKLHGDGAEHVQHN